MNSPVMTQTALPQTTRAARVSLALLLAINLFNYVDRQVLAAVEPEIGKTFFGAAADDSATLAKTGSLATAFLVSYMLAAPLLGWLADRMSRWVLVGLSVAVWSFATGGSGLAATYFALLITRCFVGVGEAGYGPAAPTIISDLFPVERRGAVLSWFYMAIPVGSALGYVLGGWITSFASWRVAFYVATPPGLILAIICFFMRDPRDSSSGTRRKKHARIKREDYLALLRNRSYVLDSLGMTAMTFAIGGISYWMPRYLCGNVATGARGLPASAKVVFGGVTVVAGLAATLLGGLAGDKLRRRFPGSYFLVSGFGMLTACPFILAMLYTPFPWAWIPLAVGVFFLFFNTGPTNAILANVTEPAVRATAFAINILIIHALGDAPAPPILGYIAGKSWNAAFMVVVGFMALGGMFWLCGAKYLQADTAAVEAAVADL